MDQEGSGARFGREYYVPECFKAPRGDEDKEAERSKERSKLKEKGGCTDEDSTPEVERAHGEACSCNKEGPLGEDIRAEELISVAAAYAI